MIEIELPKENLIEHHFKTEPDCPPSSRVEYVKTFQLTKRIENLKKHLSITKTP